MTVPSFGGIIKFKVSGQEALNKWAQEALQDALENSASPPESLRFQCRIATDAKENFKEIPLDNGETLKLHPRSHPQFGKDKDGNAYLTASMVYSGDGESYKFRWSGSAVPLKMQQVAVKHDKGKGVRGTTVGLDLSKAEVTPSWKAYGTKHPSERDREKENATRRLGYGIPGGVSGKQRAKRRCGRLTESDVKA